jgi:hypothetical protein
MSKAKWLFIFAGVLLAFGAAFSESMAQQGKGGGKGGAGKGGRGPGGGPGKGGRGPGGGGGGDRADWARRARVFNFQDLNIEDIRPEGSYEVLNLLPTASDQPRIGLTDTIAYRFADYDPDNNTLTFVTVNLLDGQLASKEVRMGNDAPKFQGMPRMAFDGGRHAVISQQAATVFVDIEAGRARVAAGFDSSVPVVEGPPPRSRRGGRGGRGEWPGMGRSEDRIPARAYRVYGGADGAHALAMLQEYDQDSRLFTSSNAVLHSASGRSVNLSWSHTDHGVPPRGRDAVFAVTDDEIVVMVIRPKDPSDSDSWQRLSFLVFNSRGELKEVQEAPGNYSSRTVNNYYLSPTGRHFVAHPDDGIHMAVYERGTWERLFSTDYNDPCIGFDPRGNVGVFLTNHTSSRAAIKAVRLSDQETLWETTIDRNQVSGNGDQRPFTAVGPGAAAVATTRGIIAGRTTDEVEYLYTAEAVEFKPLAMTYDEQGRHVAVLARDRVFVLDARTREETHSIPFEEALPENALGEFITFDQRGRNILACVRDQGVWLIDLTKGSIETTLPAIPGTWVRPMPDLSAVLYSQPANMGGNLIRQPLDGSDPTTVYTCVTPDVQAVCLWISARGDEFLVVERGASQHMYLLDSRGRKVVEYAVSELDERLSGDNAIAAFVTRRRQVVMLSEASAMNRTGINCVVINTDSSNPLEASFTCIIDMDELPGRSTYGETAASPFFGALHGGDERTARFACPAGVLEVNIQRQQFTLHAWSRQPQGLAAVNPRAREFFVAGSNGLTTYRMR